LFLILLIRKSRLIRWKFEGGVEVIEYDFVELNKYKILEEKNYTKDDRDFFISKTDKRVFSFGRISNESIAWLEQEINQPNTTGEWQFFCNNYPSEGLQADIVSPYV
jgi:hypothetical protein